MSELSVRMRELVNQMDEDLKKFPYAGDNSSEEGYLLWQARNVLSKLATEAHLNSYVDKATISALTYLRERIGPNLDYEGAVKILETVIDGLKLRKQ
jgi:hypothetical protein